MEQDLLKLLEDFHSGRLQAFGNLTVMYKILGPCHVVYLPKEKKKSFLQN